MKDDNIKTIRNLKCSLSFESLHAYLRAQLANSFPDKVESNHLKDIILKAIDKVQYCFSAVNLKHFHKNNKTYFNHLNSDQYTVFIYYASNIAYEEYYDEVLASKLFYLNKILNQFHCMYDTKLPNIFLLIHSTGIVLGKANYDDYFVVSHHCTVGANAKLEYPKVEKCVIMYPYSSAIGMSKIESGTCLSNGSYVNETLNLGRNKIVFGRSPSLVIKKNEKNRIAYFFKGFDEDDKS